MTSTLKQIDLWRLKTGFKDKFETEFNKIMDQAS